MGKAGDKMATLWVLLSDMQSEIEFELNENGYLFLTVWPK